MLALYGALSGYVFGFMLNLSFWPFVVDPQSTVAYVPGAALALNVHRYLVFDATTSLGWDTGRAITNFVCIVLVGPAMLATFRRAARRARAVLAQAAGRPGHVFNLGHGIIPETPVDHVKALIPILDKLNLDFDRYINVHTSANPQSKAELYKAVGR